MNGRRAIVGLCMLCALLVSAFAAQSASAVTKGTTLFTCTSTANPKDFKTEHCVPGESGTSFGHEAVAENTTTEFTVTNDKTSGETTGKTSTVIKTTVAGVPLTITATTVTGSGLVKNTKDPTTGEHYLDGEATLTFTGVTASAAGCKVITDGPGEGKEEGVIHTTPLTVTSKGQGDRLKLSPAVGGEPILRFELTGCTNGALNGTRTLTGSFTCPTTGATTTCTHADVTTQGTLLHNGVKTGIEGKFTLKGKHQDKAEECKPLSVTTVETA